MSEKNTILYFTDILECVELIEKYTKDVRWHDFERDVQMQDAIVRRFEIIGEAVKRIPDSMKEENPGIPWKKISGMRDILAHQYDKVHLGWVWKTIQEELGSLKTGVKVILEKLKSDQSHG